MVTNRLNVINSPASTKNVEPSPFSQKNSLKALEIEQRAKFERLWLINPEKFNPKRNCLERERIKRTWELLTSYSNPYGKKIADIGCGTGIFSIQLAKAGASVDAIDIAENALKKLKNECDSNIHLKCDAMPNTNLQDQNYDIIICTELIAEMPRNDYRLFFAELSRLIKPNGILICSTSIDIHTEGGVDKFIGLAKTEWTIIDATESYHKLYLHLKSFLKSPLRFTKAWQDPSHRQAEMSKKNGLNRIWYQMNTSPLLVGLWYSISPLAKWCLNFLNNSTFLLITFEKISRLIWDKEAVSHYVFIAKQKKLLDIDEKSVPIEKLGKKEIWN